MTIDGITLVFHNTPFFIVGGLAGTFLLLIIALRVKDWREEISERREAEKKERGKEYRGVALEAAPRREAMELAARMGAVRARMLELDRALTQRGEGVRWRFGIGGADNAFRDADADSDVDQFLSGATRRDLEAAQGEMISLFRSAANWLEKYAPEEPPPPSLWDKAVYTVRTFLSKFFPALKPDADRKMIPVVEKAEKKHFSDEGEPSKKVADSA